MDNEMGDGVEIQAAVEAIWAAPTCSAAHQRFLKAASGIIRRFAWDISLSAEDRADAVLELQSRLLEVALPPAYRRISDLTGKVIAGYDPARVKNAFLFFYGVAKSKALDILKSRKRAATRARIMQNLLEHGHLALVNLETPRDILENRRAGIEAGGAARDAGDTARRRAFTGGTL